MIVVHSQLALQSLLVALDVSFWIFTFVLLDFLSMFSSTAAQMASVVTTIGGLYSTAVGEYSRMHARRAFFGRSDPDYRLTYVSPGPGRDGLRDSYGEMDCMYDHEATRIVGPRYGVRRQLNLWTMAAFVSLIIATMYGSKVLHLVLAHSIAPTPAVLRRPVMDASRLDLASETSELTLIPDAFDINTRWAHDLVMYNLAVNYTEVERAEEALPRGSLNETSLSRSFYALLVPLFETQTADGRAVQSCGFADRWVETVVLRGAQLHELNIPAVPFFPQIWCENATADGTRVDYMGLQIESDYLSNPSENVTMIGVDEARHAVYAASILYDTSRFQWFVMQEQAQRLSGSGLRELILDGVETFGCNLSSPAYSALFNADDSSPEYTLSSNISQTIDDLLDVYQHQDTNACMAFTLKGPIETNTYSAYNRVIACYYRANDRLTVSQARYRARSIQYPLGNKTAAATTPWANRTSANVYFAGVHILPLVINVKPGPFVYAVLARVLGYEMTGAAELQISFASGYFYNVTSVVVALAAVCAASALLLALCRLVFFRIPQGVPSYYGLLHEYHQQRLHGAEGEGDGDVPWADYLPVTALVEPAYEGEGFDRRAYRVRVGILNAATYRTGV